MFVRTLTLYACALLLVQVFNDVLSLLLIFLMLKSRLRCLGFLFCLEGYSFH